MNKYTNIDILSGLVSNDNNIYSFILHDNYPSIQRLALLNHCSIEDAEDALHESILILKDKANQRDFKLTCNYKTYLYSICKNIFSDKLRKSSRLDFLNDIDLIELIDNNLGLNDEIELTQEVISFDKEEREKENNKKLLGLTFVGDKVRLVELTPDGKYRFLDYLGNYHNILYTCSLESVILKKAIDEFEFLINDSKTKEEDLHDFFVRYPQFIINDEYKSAHSKVVLDVSIDEYLVPDFVLEPINKNSLSDILELKLPRAKIIVREKNKLRYSSSILRACAQLRTYSQYFDIKENREKFKSRYGLNVYRPKLIVLIGKKGDVNSIDYKNLELDLGNYFIKTYDDLLERMRFKLTSL